MRSDSTYSSDYELFRHFMAGEETAFTAVYDRFYFGLCQYARQWLPETQDAEDVTADTFVKLWNRRNELSHIENIPAFLYVSVRNACLDLRRRQQRIREYEEMTRFESADPVETDFTIQQIREDFLKLIYAEVEKMPARMREVFLLSYKEGLRPAEIAKILDLSVHTVSNQKLNALQFLKKAFAARPILLALVLLLENQTVGKA